MPQVVGVRFRTSPRMYYFAPTEGEVYEKDMPVVVETQRGVELATVILATTEVGEDKIVAPLKPILRIATDADLESVAIDEKQKHDILATAKEKVSARGLEMKRVDCEFTVDRGKLVLYFTAEQRVDFRELVRDLASAFHTRIDLRQIGARDECKLIGSLGSCGMPCCCGRFESDSEHVSIKMAKNQNLALTPNKINGMCGRLLCCLSYENKTYEDIMRRMPKHGQFVTAADGKRGSVVSVTPLTEKVRIRVGDDENFEFCEYPLSELKFERRGTSDDQSSNGENVQQNKQPELNNGNSGNKNNHRNKNKKHGNPNANPNGNANSNANRNGEGKQKQQNENNRDGQNGNGGKDGRHHGHNRNRHGGKNKNKQPETSNAQ